MNCILSLQNENFLNIMNEKIRGGSFFQKYGESRLLAINLIAREALEAFQFAFVIGFYAVCTVIKVPIVILGSFLQNKEVERLYNDMPGITDAWRTTLSILRITLAILSTAVFGLLFSPYLNLSIHKFCTGWVPSSKIPVAEPEQQPVPTKKPEPAKKEEETFGFA